MKKIIFILLMAFGLLKAQTQDTASVIFQYLPESVRIDTTYILLAESPSLAYKVTWKNLQRSMDFSKLVHTTISYPDDYFALTHSNGGLDTVKGIKASNLYTSLFKDSVTTSLGTATSAIYGYVDSSDSSLLAAINLIANVADWDSVNNRLIEAEAGILLNANSLDTLDGEVSTLSSSLYLYARKDSIISSINITPEGIKISGSKIEVGGWSINSTSLYTGTEDHSGYTANTGDLTIYSNGTDASIHGKYFYIDATGKLYATGADIAGSINITNTTTFANGGALSLDDVANGSTYGRVLTTSISAGEILLSKVIGNLDDIADGTSYSKVASTEISAGKVVLVGNTASININNTTFGTDGIQLQYNSGNPRVYIGDGANQYFRYDGTNVSWKGTNSELTAAGAFTASNANITGTVNISNPTTFVSGGKLNTTDLTNGSSWDNTSAALTSGVSLSAGGITLGTTSVIKSGQTAYNTGTGWWLGIASGTPKLSMGNGSTKTFTYDGTDFALVGGTITGGTIQTKSSGGNRVVISTDNTIKIYNTAGDTPASIYADGATGLSLLHLDAYTVDIGAFLTEVSGIFAVADQKFIVGNDGTITKVNNLAASSCTNRFLVSDGTSYTPTALTSSHVTTALGFTPTSGSFGATGATLYVASTSGGAATRPITFVPITLGAVTYYVLGEE